MSPVGGAEQNYFPLVFQIVEKIDDGGEGCRLAGSRRAGDDDHAAADLGQLTELGRQAELVDGHDLGGNDPEHRTGASLLSEDICPEPPDLVDLPTGCAFRARCEFEVDRCKTEIPNLASHSDPVTSEDRLSACFESERLAEFVKSTTAGGGPS